MYVNAMVVCIEEDCDHENTGMEWRSLGGAELAWFVQLRHFRRTNNVEKFSGNFISTVAHFMFYAGVRAHGHTQQ